MTSVVTLWLAALPVFLGLGLVAWVIATARRNAGLVDIFWSLFFLAGAAVYAAVSAGQGARTWLATSCGQART